ncbi:hypothetical protein ARMSODRAFT_977230 [Armillaria solidipes]|uniref:Uncharacterized protein n=1 Tax=Armillaria solidipes TaxID=1076256 RepID=A0A2H3BHY7_9AGAR|nr:hypothetical protein ARMSODRAFT_977230 [Armillaria solidipes]
MRGERTAKLNAFKSKLFKKESKEVQQEWAATVDEEHEEVIKEYNERIEAPMSKDPADMQRCLEQLHSVVQPFIEMIGEATGFHAGKTLGTVKQNFVQSERTNYHKYLVPMFGNFLKRCFSVETCQARTLTANTPTLESIGFASEDQGVAHDTIEGDMYNEAGDSIDSGYKDINFYSYTTSCTTFQASRWFPVAIIENSRTSTKSTAITSTYSVKSTLDTSISLPIDSTATIKGPILCTVSMPITIALSRVSSQPVPSVGAVPPKSPLESDIACRGPQVKTTLPDEGEDASQRTLKESEPLRKDARMKKRKADIDEASDRPRKKGKKNHGKGEKPSVESRKKQSTSSSIVNAVGSVQEAFVESSKFGAFRHPQAVHNWIARGHWPKFQLQPVPKGIDPVKEFGSKFWAWWSNLQPDFRPKDDDLLELDEDGCPLRMLDGNWDDMRLPGANGWLSVVAGLCFWFWQMKGMNTSGKREKVAADCALQSWNIALEDVEWVLGHFNKIPTFMLLSQLLHKGRMVTARLENHIVQELLIYTALYKAKWLRQYRPTPFKITVETVTYTCTDAETGEHEVVDRQWRSCIIIMQPRRPFLSNFGVAMLNLFWSKQCQQPAVPKTSLNKGEKIPGGFLTVARALARNIVFSYDVWDVHEAADRERRGYGSGFGIEGVVRDGPASEDRRGEGCPVAGSIVPEVIGGLGNWGVSGEVGVYVGGGEVVVRSGAEETPWVLVVDESG